MNNTYVTDCVPSIPVHAFVMKQLSLSVTKCPQFVTAIYSKNCYFENPENGTWVMDVYKKLLFDDAVSEWVAKNDNIINVAVTRTNREHGVLIVFALNSSRLPDCPATTCPVPFA